MTNSLIKNENLCRGELYETSPFFKNGILHCGCIAFLDENLLCIY